MSLPVRRRPQTMKYLGMGSVIRITDRDSVTGFPPKAAFPLPHEVPTFAANMT